MISILLFTKRTFWIDLQDDYVIIILSRSVKRQFIRKVFASATMALNKTNSSILQYKD